jgi:hypothetical protein
MPTTLNYVDNEFESRKYYKDDVFVMTPPDGPIVLTSTIKKSIAGVLLPRLLR